MKTCLTLLLVYNHISKLKQTHDLIVCQHWSMDEFVVLKIHFVEKSKHIVQMFALYPYPSFPQSS